MKIEALLLESGLKPTCMHVLSSAKYSLVVIWSALVINEMEIWEIKSRFPAKVGCSGLYPIWGGNSGHFKKGHDFFKGVVVSAEGGCQKIQKCHASEQLSLKLETNSPAQHSSLPLPCSPKLFFCFVLFF